jgi:hypothetical protein
VVEDAAGGIHDTADSGGVNLKIERRKENESKKKIEELPGGYGYGSCRLRRGHADRNGV